jgi:hypothetical protein
MSVVECDVPSGSMLSRELIERADFRDSTGHSSATGSLASSISFSAYLRIISGG